MFKYNRLAEDRPEIRVFTIEKAESTSAPLRLQLIHVDLDSKPNYLTLSYTWDSPGPKFPACWGDGSTKLIQINGQKFCIRFNLFSALKRLRPCIKDGSMCWADAICINQSCPTERNHQVSLMKEIYSRSQTTLIWLGPSDAGTEIAFRKINQMADELSKIRAAIRNELAGEFKDAHQALKRVFEAESIIQTSGTEWEAVLDLCQRHYWRRAWIVQEIILTPRKVVICGPFHISWLTVFTVFPMVHHFLRTMGGSSLLQDVAFTHVQDRLREYSVAMDSIDCLLYLTRNNSQPETSTDSLLEVLPYLRGQECKDPKDKVFAAIGLLRNEEGLSPDYSKSVETLFQDVAVRYIQTHSSLHILGFCFYSPNLGIPTWAPDWSQTTECHREVISEANYLVKMRSRPPLYSAGGLGRVESDFKNQKSTLLLKGAFLDTLSFVSSQRWRLTPPQPLVHVIPKILHEWTLALPKSKDFLPLVDCADWEYSETSGVQQFKVPVYRPSGDSIYVAIFRAISADVIPMSNFKVRNTKFDEKSKVEDLCDEEIRYSSWMWLHRTFSVSHSGWFCLVPEEAQPGDKIGIISGWEVPLLLRPHQNNYYLVGECYVHGIMDGEGIEMIMKMGGWQEIAII
jgi:hypothetical protein